MNEIIHSIEMRYISMLEVVLGYRTELFNISCDI